MSLSTHRSSGPRGRRTTDVSQDITREQIARDLAAFRRGGGKIERLGTTRVLSRVDETTTSVPRPVAVPTRTHA